MTTLTSLLIAFSLSLDAFSVSFSLGSKYNSFRHYFRLGWHFALFQFLMFYIGGLIGNSLVKLADNLNFIAAFILFFISYKMVKSFFSSDDDENINFDPTKGWMLVTLSVSTSLDALSVGFAATFLNLNLLKTAVLIGIVCLSFSLFGVYFGSKFSNFIGKKSDLFAAFILSIIGIKILVG